MCDVAVSIPEEVLYDTQMSKSEAEGFARLMTALGYYTRNNVSIGYCAQIAGVPEEDFMRFLATNNTSVFSFDNAGDFSRELANA